MRRLLDKAPEHRLGANGFDEILDCEFFTGLDWDALLAMRIAPPFRPQVGSALDVGFFDAAFTRAEVDTDNFASRQSLSPLDSSGNLRSTGFSFARGQMDAMEQQGSAPTRAEAAAAAAALAG